MATPSPIAESPEKLLKRFAEAPELKPFELALYDHQFQLVAISTPQAALCGNFASAFCNPACHADKAAKMAATEFENEPRLIHCPGNLQQCLVPGRNANGQRIYLLIGGGRGPQINLPYLEELACLNQKDALPLLKLWHQLQQFKTSELLAAGRTAQLLFLPNPASAPGINSPGLSEALIEALLQADSTMASATDLPSLKEAINSLLEPAFGPRSSSLLAPEESTPDLHCLGGYSAAPPSKAAFLSSEGNNSTPPTGDEQLTCLPLQRDNELLGSLLCCGPSPSARDLQLLKLLAERISYRLQQLKSPQISPERPVLDNKKLHRLLAIKKPQELCRYILKDAITLVPASKASVMLLNNTGSKLHLLASIGMSQAMAANLCVPANKGIAGQVLQSGLPLLVEDLEQDPRISSTSRPRFTSKSLLCLPLTTGNKHHGVICLTDRQDDQPFTQQDLQRLTSLAGPSALLIERLLNRRKIVQLIDQTALDSATGVYSANMFQRRFIEEASRSTRLQQSLALLLFKSDQPDQTNQQQTLELATRLKDLVRKMDIVGRLDQNLFAVVLPDTAREVALTIGNRLHGQNDDAETYLNFGVSCGIALYPNNGASFNSLLQSAKDALARAHQQGGKQTATCESSALNSKIVFI